LYELTSKLVVKWLRREFSLRSMNWIAP